VSHPLVQDLNGDGRLEIILGAPYAYNTRGVQSGAAFVIWGTSASRRVVNVSSMSSSVGFIVNGIDHDDRVGWSVATARRFRSFRTDAFVIGAPGANSVRTWIYFEWRLVTPIIVTMLDSLCCVIGLSFVFLSFSLTHTQSLFIC
jgi:hypothetical protein